MSAKTEGYITCQVRLTNGKEEKLKTVVENLSKNLRVTDTNFIKQKNNQNSIIVNIEYGWVKGGAEYDVRRFFQNAVKQTGTAAQIELINYKRKSRPIEESCLFVM